MLKQWKVTFGEMRGVSLESEEMTFLLWCKRLERRSPGSPTRQRVDCSCAAVVISRVPRDDSPWSNRLEDPR